MAFNWENGDLDVAGDISATNCGVSGLTINGKQIYAPYELYYDNTEKGTAGSITLSDSANNYDYLEIYYNWEEDYGYNSAKINNPDGKIASIFSCYDNGTYYYTETTRYSINGTSFTRDNGVRWRFGTSGSPTRTNTTTSGGSIRIYQIIGYK